MKKCIVTLGMAFLGLGIVQAQDTEEQPKPKKKNWSTVNVGERANDHFMFQFGYDGWVSRPDSIRTTGIGRHLNIYLMLDKPFKTDPRFSVGLGVGIGSSNIFFDKTYVDLKGSINPGQVTFRDVRDADHFDKYKLTTVWAEAPIELRYISNPLRSDRSWKVAIGVKVGTMISAHTKGKDLQNKDGQTLHGPKYIMKEKDRKHMSNLRLAPTIRMGYGNFTIYSAYQISALFRDAQGPNVRPFSVGMTISGL